MGNTSGGIRTSGDPPRPQLVGRSRELAATAQVLATVRDGLSATLVLRGPAGIGKTALLDECQASAGDLDVQRLDGIESEMELGFAGLHQLLAPLLERVDDLPEPQARALRSAFGLGDDTPDRFLVSLAALNLVAASAGDRGVLVLVDDAQWLDRESANVIAFVARRLLADRVGIIIAVREPTARELPFEALDSISLDHLDAADAAAVVVSAVDGPVNPLVLTRLVADAQGNPLALSELPSELSADQLAGHEALPDTLALGARVEARFLRQVRSLSDDGKLALLVAACDPTGDVDLVRRCGSHLGYGPDAIYEAVQDQLISVGAVIRFRHPLIRSAVYHGATQRARRRAHAALAAVTDVTVDPDRRAWHRGASVVGTDGEAAADLEAAAGRARQRGGSGAAAVFLNRAAELSPDRSRRSGLHLMAAEMEWEAGDVVRAEACLTAARPGLGDGVDRSRAMRLECLLLVAGVGHGGAAKAPAAMLDAARQLARVDVTMGRALLLGGMSIAVYVGSCAPGVPLLDFARETSVMALPDGAEHSCGDLLLEGLSAWALRDHATAAPLLRGALAALMSDQEARSNAHWLVYGCWAAFALGDTEVDRQLAERLEQVAREANAWKIVQEALYYRRLAALSHGSLPEAKRIEAESDEIEAAQNAVPSLSSAVVSAWFLPEPDLRGRLEHQRAQGSARRTGMLLAEADYAEAILELGRGNHRRAWEVYPTDLGGEMYISTSSVADLVEAAVRSGDRAAAEVAVERYTPAARASGSPLMRGLLARARALLADPDDAEALYVASIDALVEADAVGNVARSRLVYGEWLRRGQRRRDAREQLRLAFESFDAMGAVHFRDRAQAELAATGATARRRTDETRSDLTPQEARIARLAADGSTNPEIAEMVFISVNTVDYHLRKVFRKLGIQSRRQLGHALPVDA